MQLCEHPALLHLHRLRRSVLALTQLELVPLVLVLVLTELVQLLLMTWRTQFHDLSFYMVLAKGVHTQAPLRVLWWHLGLRLATGSPLALPCRDQFGRRQSLSKKTGL